jgi:hypothetical protein
MFGDILEESVSFIIYHDDGCRKLLRNLVNSVRFEDSTDVTMKNDVFWDVTPCGSCKNRRFGGTWHLHHHGDKNR